MQTTLCVCVLINKRSFERFLCFDTKYIYPTIQPLMELLMGRVFKNRDGGGGGREGVGAVFKNRDGGGGRRGGEGVGPCLKIETVEEGGGGERGWGRV